MTLLDKKIDEGVAEVYTVAETVDGKITKAEADMDAAVAEVYTVAETVDEAIEQGKVDMDAMVETVEGELENIEKNKLNAYSFGAIADNKTDNYTSLHNIFKKVGDSVVYDTSINSNRFFTKTVDIPPGLYRVKQPNLFKDCFGVRAQNLVINGNGATIILEDFEGSLFVNNDKAINVDIYNLNFISVSDSYAANRYLISSDSDGGAQAIRFHQCAFNGRFKYVIELTGSNCNSEWVFNQCTLCGVWDSFLYIGNTDTSDQFLNYWFNNCKYWCSSNWITAYKGGHFKLNHCDVSGYEPAEATYLFKLYGGSHSYGTTTFIDDGTRYELKSANARVIYCEWDNARVSFENSDFSSNTHNNVERNNTFYFRNDSNGMGSSYIFTNCNILGKFNLHTNNAANGCDLFLNNCYIYGGKGVSTIYDIFTFTYAANYAAIFKVYLNHVKCSGKLYSMLLYNFRGEYNILSNKATLIQSPYNNLLASWTHPVYQTTIIDEVIFFTKGVQYDGYRYEFSIKSDTDSVVEKTNPYGDPTYVQCSNTSHFFKDNKITFGNSNTVYTITYVDLITNSIKLDKDVTDAAIGDVISFNILDVSYTPNTNTRFSTSSKYIVRNRLYLKTTGSTAIGENGINGAIIVKTLE